MDDVTTILGFSAMLATVATALVQLAKQRWPEQVRDLVAVALAVAIGIVLAVSLDALDTAPAAMTWKSAISAGLFAGLTASGIYGFAKAVNHSNAGVQAARAEGESQPPVPPMRPIG